MPNLARITARLQAEAKSYAFSAAGGGSSPWVPLAQRDHVRLVGSLADHPTVSIALAWLRRNIGQGRLIVGTEAGGDYKEVENHPLTNLFRRPNRDDSWASTLSGTADSLKIDGNAYWLKARAFKGKGDVAEVYWAPNHQVVVEAEDDAQRIADVGPVRRYGFQCSAYGRDGIRWYEPSEVVHFRDGRDPNCRYMGLSDLKRQLRNATSIVAAERYTAAVLLNAHAGKVLAPTEAVGEIMAGTPDEATMIGLVRSISRGLSDENAGSITKSNLPVTMLNLGMGPEEMVLDRITDRPESYIVAAIGVNSMTLGLPSSKDMATYANFNVAVRQSWENGVIPLQDLIAEEIISQLLPDFDSPKADAVWWDRKDVQALREDANERATRAVAIWATGNQTVNEFRSLVDLGPLDGGDKSPIEIAEEGKEEAARIAAGKGNEEQDEDDDPEGEDDDDPFDPEAEAKGFWPGQARAPDGTWVSTGARRRTRAQAKRRRKGKNKPHPEVLDLRKDNAKDRKQLAREYREGKREIIREHTKERKVLARSQRSERKALRRSSKKLAAKVKDKPKGSSARQQVADHIREERKTQRIEHKDERAALRDDLKHSHASHRDDYHYQIESLRQIERDSEAEVLRRLREPDDDE